MRGDESLAYDLTVRVGRVRGRVALLLRSTERKPLARLDFLRVRPFGRILPPSEGGRSDLWEGVEGGEGLVGRSMPGGGAAAVHHRVSYF
jgi:hypothetical protein